MKSKILRRGVSSLLAILLAFELIPVQVYAAEYDTYDPEMTDPAYAYDYPEEDFLYDDILAETAVLTEEIPVLRDEYQKVFMMENGMQLAAVYPMAVHYGSNGEWREINNDLCQFSDENGRSYRNIEGMWDVILPEKLNESSGITVIHEGHELSFSLSKEIIKTDGNERETAETEETGNVTGSSEDPGDEEIDNASEYEGSAETAKEEDGAKNDAEESIEEAAADVTADGETEAEVLNEGTIPVSAEDKTEQYETVTVNPVRGEIAESEGKEPFKDPLIENILEQISSAVVYEGILEDTDLRYDLISNQLKETITINRYREELCGYEYRIKADDLTLELTEDGMITAVPIEGGEAAFWLPQPVMYDADLKANHEIDIELKEAEEGYVLTYILPAEWLADPDTEYPVSLDPVIQPVSNTWTIQDQSVSEFHNLDYTWGCVEMGYFPPVSGGGGRERVFMKFQNLPALTAADVIVSASVSMYKPEAGGLTIEAHQVNGTWDSSTITWQNMPSVNSLIEDYAVTNNTGWYTWDITNIAQNWYAKNLNSGVMFKVPDSIENGGSLAFDQFYSSDYSPAYSPVLLLAYVNNCGVEDTWDHLSHNMGRAGTGYVDLYTGNIVWVHDGLGFSGTRMPAAIKHIYNANDKSNNSFGMGYGWRTNYNQLVYQWSVNSAYYVWEDADGTRQYFKYKSSGLYENELDSTLKLTTTGSGTTKYCITDSKNNKSYFDTYGRLTKIKNNQ